MLLPGVRRLRLAVALASWAGVLVLIRLFLSGSPFGLFLAWNLVLAAVPLAISTAVVHLDRQGTRWPALVALGAVWLLFLPNAPYILTDLVHLRDRPPVPYWYDLGMLLSAAGVGLLSGYVSLADIHHVVARRVGPRVAWALAVGVLFLSGFGIYLGRELRWNSWDVVTAPGALLADIAARVLDPLAHPSTVATTLVFGGMLTVGYVALRALAAPAEPSVAQR
ncbi:MAG: DUF1361 domain-containing protein [Bacteroidota bacterium]